VKPPLIVDSNILHLRTRNGIMVLYHTQLIVEREDGFLNFTALFMSSTLVNLQSSECTLLRIEKGRGVLNMLFEAWS
jgi:hypothetical protein